MESMAASCSSRDLNGNWRYGLPYHELYAHGIAEIGLAEWEREDVGTSEKSSLEKQMVERPQDSLDRLGRL
jgi:hypothetical protein